MKVFVVLCCAFAVALGGEYCHLENLHILINLLFVLEFKKVYFSICIVKVLVRVNDKKLVVNFFEIFFD